MKLKWAKLRNTEFIARFEHGRVDCLQFSDFAIDMRALEAGTEMKSCAMDIKMCWLFLWTKEGRKLFDRNDWNSASCQYLILH